MEGIPADYKMDGRGHVPHGDALAFFAGVAPTPQRIDGLHRRVWIGSVLVGANLPNGRNQWTPECWQHGPPGRGARPA
jgi:hypothetical protein